MEIQYMKVFNAAKRRGKHRDEWMNEWTTHKTSTEKNNRNFNTQNKASTTKAERENINKTGVRISFIDQSSTHRNK